MFLIRIRTKWNNQSPSPKQNPAKQTSLCLWRVEYNKAVKQPLFSVCSVCSNKVWLGCLVWDENTLFEVMHMQCDSPCLWAVFLCPSRFSCKSCLLEPSIVGKLGMGRPLHGCAACSDFHHAGYVGRLTGVNSRPLCFCRTGENRTGGELLGRWYLLHFIYVEMRESIYELWKEPQLNCICCEMSK